MDRVALAKALGLRLESSARPWDDSSEWVFRFPYGSKTWEEKYFSIEDVECEDKAWQQAADKIILALRKQICVNMGNELREDAW